MCFNFVKAYVPLTIIHLALPLLEINGKINGKDYGCCAGGLSESYKLHSSRQFAFKKARSTEGQMLLVYSEVVKSVDAGSVLGMTIHDFSKSI